MRRVGISNISRKATGLIEIIATTATV